VPEKTIQSVWGTLKDRERAVLRIMAETVKPESEATIADYLASQFNFNRVHKALGALRSLNLVVVKRHPRGPDLLELHPLVRNFIRRSFSPTERATYIDPIIRVYKRFISSFKARLTDRPALSTLQYWTQNAELDISVGNMREAVTTLAEVSQAFLISSFPREFVRVTRKLFAAVDWVTTFHEFREFDALFSAHLMCLAHLGEADDVDKLLEQYEKTVPHHDSRYIQYCALRGHSLWYRGSFAEAVEWGRNGKGVAESGIDSESTNFLTHTLALAERDAGRPEVALPVFLEGRPLAEVTNPDELDRDRPEHHYGNVGRCLHFMGQFDSALVCYQKAALLLEQSTTTPYIMNKAYARQWIGELLFGRGEHIVAYAFLQSASRLWEQVSPPRGVVVGALMKQIEEGSAIVRLKDRAAERVCIEWILGHDIDPGLRPYTGPN
jgi:tetratricopeptide (TPR) repeat protein